MVHRGQAAQRHPPDRQSRARTVRSGPWRCARPTRRRLATRDRSCRGLVPPRPWVAASPQPARCDGARRGRHCSSLFTPARSSAAGRDRAPPGIEPGDRARRARRSPDLLTSGASPARPHRQPPEGAPPRCWACRPGTRTPTSPISRRRLCRTQHAASPSRRFDRLIALSPPTRKPAGRRGGRAGHQLRRPECCSSRCSPRASRQPRRPADRHRRRLRK